MLSAFLPLSRSGPSTPSWEDTPPRFLNVTRCGSSPRFVLQRRTRDPEQERDEASDHGSLMRFTAPGSPTTDLRFQSEPSRGCSPPSQRAASATNISIRT